jgi:hypothetical protein
VWLVVVRGVAVGGAVGVAVAVAVWGGVAVAVAAAVKVLTASVTAMVLALVMVLSMATAIVAGMAAVTVMESIQHDCGNNDTSIKYKGPWRNGGTGFSNGIGNSDDQCGDYDRNNNNAIADADDGASMTATRLSRAGMCTFHTIIIYAWACMDSFMYQIAQDHSLGGVHPFLMLEAFYYLLYCISLVSIEN